MEIHYSRIVVCMLAEQILIAAKLGKDRDGLQINVPLSISNAEKTARAAIQSALATGNTAIFRK